MKPLATAPFGQAGPLQLTGWLEVEALGTEALAWLLSAIWHAPEPGSPVRTLGLRATLRARPTRPWPTPPAGTRAPSSPRRPAWSGQLARPASGWCSSRRRTPPSPKPSTLACACGTRRRRPGGPGPAVGSGCWRMPRPGSWPAASSWPLRPVAGRRGPWPWEADAPLALLAALLAPLGPARIEARLPA
ncbi:MAG: hypothetical protein R3F60_26360 [bacterium]